MYQKKSLFYLVIVISVFSFLYFSLRTNRNTKHHNTIKVGISADYPPFEYYENGILVGFDIDLAKAIAHDLNKNIEFVDMPFNSLFSAIESNFIDFAISGISINEERLKNFDFSHAYYNNSTLGILHKKGLTFALSDQSPLTSIGYQTGSVLESWIKENFKNKEFVSMSSNGQLIEALKTGYIDCVVIGVVQALEFAKNNPDLEYSIIENTTYNKQHGYSIGLKKNSPLTTIINETLQHLEENGTLKNLKTQWIESATKHE